MRLVRLTEEGINICDKNVMCLDFLSQREALEYLKNEVDTRVEVLEQSQTKSADKSTGGCSNCYGVCGTYPA